MLAEAREHGTKAGLGPRIISRQRFQHRLAVFEQIDIHLQARGLIRVIFAAQDVAAFDRTDQPGLLESGHPSVEIRKVILEPIRSGMCPDQRELGK